MALSSITSCPTPSSWFWHAQGHQPELMVCLRGMRALSPFQYPGCFLAHSDIFPQAGTAPRPCGARPRSSNCCQSPTAHGLCLDQLSWWFHWSSCGVLMTLRHIAAAVGLLSLASRRRGQCRLVFGCSRKAASRSPWDQVARLAARNVCAGWFAIDRSSIGCRGRPSSLLCRLLPLPCHYRSNHLALSRLLSGSASSVDKGGTRAARVVGRQAAAGLVVLEIHQSAMSFLCSSARYRSADVCQHSSAPLPTPVFVELVSRLCGARCLTWLASLPIAVRS